MSRSKKKKKELLFELNKIWGVIKETIGKIKCNNQKSYATKVLSGKEKDYHWLGTSCRKI